MEDHLSTIYSILSGADTAAMQQISITGFMFLMVMSLLSSLFIAFLYVQFFENRATGSRFIESFRCSASP